MTILQLPAVGRQHGRRLDRWFTGIGGAVVLGVPFAAFSGLVLSHFYVSGSFLLDAGWTAHLLTHGGLSLRYPSSLGD